MPIPVAFVEKELHPLATLQTEIEAYFLGEGYPPEVAERFAKDTVHRVAVSPVCALDVQGRYLGYPAEPKKEGGWVQGGHRRHFRLFLPVYGNPIEVEISLDGVPLKDVTRVSFEMRANCLATMRVDRLRRPFELSDTGGIEIDAYLYESTRGDKESRLLAASERLRNELRGSWDARVLPAEAVSGDALRELDAAISCLRGEGSHD